MLEISFSCVKISGWLALLCIHQVNHVNSCNDNTEDHFPVISIKCDEQEEKLEFAFCSSLFLSSFSVLVG